MRVVKNESFYRVQQDKIQSRQTWVVENLRWCDVDFEEVIQSRQIWVVENIAQASDYSMNVIQSRQIWVAENRWTI